MPCEKDKFPAQGFFVTLSERLGVVSVQGVFVKMVCGKNALFKHALRVSFYARCFRQVCDHLYNENS